MNKCLKHILFLIGSVLVLSSCDNYSKIQKSSDMNEKYEAAMKYYNKGDFIHASGLLEELTTAYRGTEKAEEIMYYFAMSNYNMGDYILAGYHLKNFTKNYPSSKHAEECAYLNAYCYYLSSPAYSLDQSETQHAIQALQTFMNTHPQSKRIPDANIIMDELHEKLERKAYENSKLYYNTGDYKAAVAAFQNTIKEFPGGKYAEELYYLIVKSNYLLALNSIESKKEERLKTTIETYYKFIDKYPNSSYLKSAEDIYSNTIKLQQQNQKNKSS